ncbi:Aste57867_15242 [Aphanomyces stellatus]|uniref:Purple acid phosphatase n=1 Tax=Aphanomyces stellatus TaxID=120398 RepID=A0A485L2P8_9STRA|nr:hypothetical protein As57867_015186 [Aphanomyces stellatus]VFT92051.1 Aste57867_15242 [Aphanomyces stellatus]
MLSATKLALLSAAMAAAYAQVFNQVHLGLTSKEAQNCAGGVAVSFASNQSTPFTVQYHAGTTPLGAVQTTVDSYTFQETPSVLYTSPFLHTAFLCDLKPNTVHSYAIGGAAATSFSTPPVVGTDAPTVLSVVGDVGTEHTNETLSNMVSPIKGLRPQALAIVGDWSYANGHQPIWDTFFNQGQPVFEKYPTLGINGNHEVIKGGGDSGNKDIGPDRYTGYLKRVVTPISDAAKKAFKTHYSYNFGSIHAVFLNDYSGYMGLDKVVGTPEWLAVRQEQIDWFKADLAAVDREVTPWVIVFKHNPFYNTWGDHQCQCGPTLFEIGDVDACWKGDKAQDPQQAKEPACSMQAKLEDLYQEYAVDLVMAGHVHAYERTEHIFKNKIDATGPVYVTMGAGGHGTADPKIPNVPAWSVASFNEVAGASRLIATKTKLEVMWRKNGQEDAADAFTLTRESGGYSTLAPRTTTVAPATTTTATPTTTTTVAPTTTTTTVTPTTTPCPTDVTSKPTTTLATTTPCPTDVTPKPTTVTTTPCPTDVTPKPTSVTTTPCPTDLTPKPTAVTTTPCPTDVTPKPTSVTTTPCPTDLTPKPTAVTTTPCPTDVTPKPTSVTTTPCPTDLTPKPTAVTTTPCPTDVTPKPTSVTTTPCPTDLTPKPTAVTTTPCPTDITPKPTAVTTTPCPTDVTPKPTTVTTTPCPTDYTPKPTTVTTTPCPTDVTPKPTSTTLSPVATTTTVKPTTTSSKPTTTTSTPTTTFSKPTTTTPKPTTTTSKPTTGAPSQCSAPVDGVDYYGHDIKSVSCATADVCCDECATTSGCVAYVWTPWQDGTCFLKWKVGKTTPYWGAIAAQKPYNGPTCDAPESNVDYFGNDLEAVEANVDDCCALCLTHDDCQGYSHFDGVCYLKSELGYATKKEGVVSAVRLA